MDKLVKRVTVVHGSGAHRQTNVVYGNDEDDDEDFETPRFSRLEKGIRHLLKAQVVAAQEAYDRHIESVEKGGNSWLVDDVFGMMKARRKAMKEAQEAVKVMRSDDEDSEDDRD